MRIRFRWPFPPSVGNDAIGIAFSDGHGSGIYTYEALRRMQEAETEDV